MYSCDVQRAGCRLCAWLSPCSKQGCIPARLLLVAHTAPCWLHFSPAAAGDSRGPVAQSGAVGRVSWLHGPAVCCWRGLYLSCRGGVRPFCCMRDDLSPCMHLASCVCTCIWHDIFRPSRRGAGVVCQSRPGQPGLCWCALCLCRAPLLRGPGDQLAGSTPDGQPASIWGWCCRCWRESWWGRRHSQWFSIAVRQEWRGGGGDGGGGGCIHSWG